jgi:tetratricopeptide (TPR) repeat protein
MAYLNRSLANLQLGHSENALEDAARGSEANAPSEKRLFREARALYEMGHFQTCLERLQRLMCSFSDNKAAPAELLRATARLHEQETGEYNYLVMYKDAAEKTPPLMDCATYSAPVDIRPSPGRGNGLFTTRAVNAGELLLCEKAFAYSFAEDNTNASRLLMNLKTKKMILGGQASLLTQVVQKVYNNPQMWSLFRELHHGDYAAGPYVEADGKPVIDTYVSPATSSYQTYSWLTRSGS